MRNCLLIFALLTVAINASAQPGDWSAVEKVFGRTGTVQGNVFKITFPRTDLDVKIGDIKAEPGLALTSWCAIMKTNDSAMMMGDLVLLDKEVPTALKKIISSGLEATAIHNHLIGETPSVKYIHYYGKGDASKLAESIKAVIQSTSTPFAPAAPPQSAAPDWSKVQAILGEGKLSGALLQYSFPRNEALKDHGMIMPPSMGMATAINFQMNGNTAATAGDFVLLADEVNPVIKALTESGITVTALHNHMLYDEPRLFMMHFWGTGDPEKIAQGLKAALDKTNVKK